ncbi:SWIM zinc finger family protein [Paenibacillus sp. OSY-SE]|uniref:SWIM zinc finger family protein n=1 Tax=Paenibacillus sp. OSY-SE TaxID=1196323 RepID=UPI00031E5E36|nr:SWIM zinc finger family protein [Paenibacillus sp. OSY-SE]
MNLHHLSKSIDPVIINRGRDYVLAGYVRSIKKIKDGLYRALVEGSDLYEVLVELRDNDDVLSVECDCPFDYGPTCKHQAAVLIKLREMRGTARSHSANLSSPISVQTKTLKQLLEAESKDSLISLLLYLAVDSEQMEERIRLYLSDVDHNDSIESCRHLIQSYIEIYADKYGFVRWDNVERAVEGAEHVAEQAALAFVDGKLLQAAKINICILEEMMDLLQSSDDSNGTIGGIIEESIERLDAIAQSGELLLSGEMEILFDLIMGVAIQNRFDGWPDWRVDLFAAASYLTASPDLREKWEQHIERMSQNTDEDTWSGEYFTARIAKLRYNQLQEHAGETQANDYLYSQLHFSDFRKQAIQLALDNCRYDEAIRLAEEGEAQDLEKGLPGLVGQWKQLRYDAYRLSGDVQRQRELGLELLCCGDLSYYTFVKAAYSSAEWPLVYHNLLETLEKGNFWRQESVYTQILVQEQEHARLLLYVKQHPEQVETFCPLLIEHYPKDVIHIFQKYIEWKAANSSSRKQYQGVCQVLKRFKKAAGPAEAERIVQLLLTQYPNKPAFRDELTKL